MLYIGAGFAGTVCLLGILLCSRMKEEADSDDERENRDQERDCDVSTDQHHDVMSHQQASSSHGVRLAPHNCSVQASAPSSGDMNIRPISSQLGSERLETPHGDNLPYGPPPSYDSVVNAEIQ